MTAHTHILTTGAIGAIAGPAAHSHSDRVLGS